MKKLLLLFTLLAFTFSGVNAQSDYWNLDGNSGTTSSHFIGTTDNQPLIFKTNGTERMRLLPNKSFLGIGIPIPQATLHLHYQYDMGDPSQKLLQLTTDGTGSLNGNGFSIFSNYLTKDILFKQQEQQAKFFLEGPGGGLVIAPDGNVGLGTDEPTEKLHIEDGDLLLKSSGSSNRSILFDMNGDKWGMECINSNKAGAGINFWRGIVMDTDPNWNDIDDTPPPSSVLIQSSVLFLADNGRVGVGTKSPKTKLDVSGAFKATSAEIAQTLSVPSAAIAHLTGTTTADNLRIENMLCAKEVKVQQTTCWPDYVFAKDYHLLPLSEVEQFINENQHLPNIPSAAEVEANGIELGEMNAKLLLKVEELTLYILDLQKQINELKKQ
jgi:hypothetical protein